MSDLELVSTEDLANELARRYEVAIIICSTPLRRIKTGTGVQSEEIQVVGCITGDPLCTVGLLEHFLTIRKEEVRRILKPDLD